MGSSNTCFHDGDFFFLLFGKSIPDEQAQAQVLRLIFLQNLRGYTGRSIRLANGQKDKCFLEYTKGEYKRGTEMIDESEGKIMLKLTKVNNKKEPL